MSVAGLYNPSASFTLGQGHTDGVELNGIIGHRVDYGRMGGLERGEWVANAHASGDAYAHIGMKSGGVALDGEGKYGANVPDPQALGREGDYDRRVRLPRHVASGQRDRCRSHADAAERHFQCGRRRDSRSIRFTSDHGRCATRKGTTLRTKVRRGPPTRAARPFLESPVWRTPRERILRRNDYVVWPWFVPVRVEYTRLSLDSSAPNVDRETARPPASTRVVPGVAMLVRPNIRVVLGRQRRGGRRRLLRGRRCGLDGGNGLGSDGILGRIDRGLTFASYERGHERGGGEGA